MLLLGDETLECIIGSVDDDNETVVESATFCCDGFLLSEEPTVPPDCDEIADC